MNIENQSSKLSRRSFLKKSTATGLGAKSALIYGGMSLNSYASETTCDDKYTYRTFTKVEVATEVWGRYTKPGVNGSKQFVSEREVTTTTWSPSLTTGWTAPDGQDGCSYEKDGNPEHNGHGELTDVERKTGSGSWVNTSKSVEVVTDAWLTANGWTLDGSKTTKVIRRTWTQSMKQKWKCVQDEE